MIFLVIYYVQLNIFGKEMFPCDPVILVLIVVLVVFIALIVRELIVRGEYLEGPTLFSGGNCMACGGADDYDISFAMKND